ncbi:restriction endonuclease subunit S [Carnobacterium viridans]|uniref:Type I restriction enzyme, S subunit n=1 Tax=Carnobacterium viridans TaxID=174587 RepID=A0A1H0XI68_9LACT|nr:restriction endonuclease subunit S [Carnobacterium viridans]SDQ02642.1 type I restriction enzyme, S subunit [Carnobacterium viridans]
MNKKQFIPNIRFHGFTDGWAQRRLVDEVDFFSGLTYSPDNIVKEGGTFVLRSSNVQNGEIVEADNVYVEHEAVNSTNVQVGDIVIVVRNGSRSLIGKHAAIKKPMENTVIGAFMTGIHSETSSFINALLDTRQFEIEIHKNLGATINQITTGNFKKMEFNFPTKFEQEKTGSFFKELDDTITLQQQLLNNYEQLKKAMLQKMFPQKGESVPRVRFAGFTDDWKKERLGKIIVSHSFKKYISEPIENGKYPIIQQGNNSIVGYSNDAPFIGFEDVTLFGDHTLSLYKPTSPFLVSTDGLKIISIDSFNGFFTYYLLEINNPESEGYKRHFKILKSKDVFYPDNSMEQAKIGKFLKQLDETIELHEQKLKTYQNFKKAMLQKMFV